MADQKDFPPVYVINLETSADRRGEMAARLDPLNVPYTFFKAVNGYALDIEKLPEYDGRRRRLLFGKDMTKGEVGCLLSHRAVYQHMADHNIPQAIVLEDDVFIDPSFPQLIREIVESPLPWDLVRFLAYEKVQKIGRNVYELPTKPHALARIPTTSGGAYGYLLNLKAARRLLALMKSNAMPVDMLHGYVWQTGLETFLLRPSPVAADLENESTIGAARFDRGLQLRGWERFAYPVTRAWLKFSELVGKRGTYLLSYPRDRKWRQGI